MGCSDVQEAMETAAPLDMGVSAMICRLSLVMICVLGCRTERLEPVVCEPTPEVCDGVDNNCDGIKDNGDWSCATACGSARQFCINGRLSACTAREPTPESCNGRDDDCDGFTDESADLAVSPCYPGNAAELHSGECRFGLTRCVLGASVCKGAVTPMAEECDGRDNDCDGAIDEGSNVDPTDLVFIVDNSGSMGAIMNKVRAAVSDFATTYAGRSDLRWAVVTAPAPQTPAGDVPRLWLDLSDPAAFITAIGQQDGWSGAGAEPTLDALAYVNSAANPLRISWTPGGRKVVVVFSDEEPQSYDTPKVTSLALSLKVYVFTLPFYAPLWGPYSTSIYNIDQADLRPDLDNVIKEAACN